MMEGFTAYLHRQGYSEKSIEHYLWRLRGYGDWCKKKRLDKEQLGYQDMLKYVKHLKSRGWRPQSINNQLRGIKYYFDHLMEDDIRLDNPANDVKIRRQRTKVMGNLLGSDELEDLYYSYETECINDFYFTATAKRNKVIVGLIVYQALNSSTLAKLRTEHLQLQRGKICVPGTKRSNGRTLELKPWQVLDMMAYLDEYRPKIQKHIELYDDMLFPLNSDQFHIILNGIMAKLKRTNYRVRNTSQLRASVITLWLKKHNIRETQKMAGHVCIGSTEKYVQDNLENLQEAVKSYHPLA